MFLCFIYSKVHSFLVNHIFPAPVRVESLEICHQIAVEALPCRATAEFLQVSPLVVGPMASGAEGDNILLNPPPTLGAPDHMCHRLAEIRPAQYTPPAVPHGDRPLDGRWDAGCLSLLVHSSPP